jgi:hypothetical protein
MKSLLISGLVGISPLSEPAAGQVLIPTRGSPRGVIVVSDRPRPRLRARAPGGDHALSKHE